MLNKMIAIVAVVILVGCAEAPKKASFTQQACKMNDASSLVQGNDIYRVYSNANLGTGCLVKDQDDTVQVIWRNGVEVFRTSQAVETEAWKVGSEVARAYSLELLPRSQELVTKLK